MNTFNSQDRQQWIFAALKTCDLSPDSYLGGVIAAQFHVLMDRIDEEARKSITIQSEETETTVCPACRKGQFQSVNLKASNKIYFVHCPVCHELFSITSHDYSPDVQRLGGGFTPEKEYHKQKSELAKDALKDVQKDLHILSKYL